MSETQSKRQSESTREKFLCFSLGQQKFATQLLRVKEVIGNAQTTPIPQAPPHFRGVMNLRGQVISVVDLRVKLNSKFNSSTQDETTIILDFAPLYLGIVVDSVDSVVSFDSSEISPKPDADSTVNIDYITGVIRSGDSLILILDLKAVLDANDFAAIDQGSKAA